MSMLPSELTCLSRDEAGLHGELVDRAAHGLAGRLLGDTRQLEHDASGLDVGDPPLRRALARAHAGLGRLLGVRAVGVDVDPDLAATLDVTRHGDTSRLDLTVGHVVTLHRLDAEVAEGELGSTLGHAAALGVMLLAVLDPSWHQHQLVPPSAAGAAAAGASAGSATAAAFSGWAFSAAAGAVLAGAAAGPSSRLGRRPRVGRERPGAAARLAASASRSARVP